MRRDRIEDEVREELDFHVEAQVLDLIRDGWSEEEARAEARRRFGDAGGVRQALVRMGRRRERMLNRSRTFDELAQDAAFALRQLRRQPAFTIAAGLILALGVGVATAVFAVVDVSLLRPLPFPDPHELVVLSDVQDAPGYPPSVPEFRDWQREGDFLAAAAAVATNIHTLHMGDVPERARVGQVAGDVPAVSGLRPLVGRSFTAAELAGGELVLLVDEDFWRERLGADPGIVGSSLTLDGEAVTVVGVMPRETKLLFESRDVSLWRPMPDLPDVLTRGLHLLKAVGRLEEGTGSEVAEERARRMGESLRESGVTRHGVALSPLRDELLGDTKRIVLVLAGAVALVLLVVCANLAHLSLARGWSRAREFAVRGALGAGGGRLLRQLLTESLLLGVLGFSGALVVARAVTGWVARAADSFALTELAEVGEPRVLLFGAMAALVVSLVLGWITARRAAGPLPAARLGARDAGRPGGSTRLRHALVTAEIALSAVLLTGAGLLVRTVARLMDEDPGFRAEGVLTAQIALPTSRYPTPESRVLFWDQLLASVTALPGLETAGLVSHLPFGGDTNGSFQIVGVEFPEGESPHSKKRFAGPGTFDAMGIPLLRGRAFLPSDRRGAQEVAVISRALAERYWPGEDPVGKRIRFLWQTEGEQEVIGIVGDVRSDALDLEGQGTVYLSHQQVGSPGMSLVIRTLGDPFRLGEAVRRAVLTIDPAQPIHDVVSLEALVRRSVAGRTQIMSLLSAFAALALLLAGVGVYAVAAQSVSTRTREIGVRLAVGAEPRRVMRKILGEEMVPVGLGLVVGLVGAAMAARLLTGLLYEVGERDPVTMAAVAAVLGVSALAALALPALRVLRVDPAAVLRGE